MRPIHDRLTLDYSQGESIGMTSMYTLRKVVGILGMSLPVLLYLFLLIDSGYARPLPSISHYYFTRVSSIFIIIVALMAIFLLIYKGKKPIDFYFSAIPGMAAFLLLLFPTGNLGRVCCDTDAPYAVTMLRDSGFRENFHYIAAAVFLVGLALMSFFLFTKSDKPKELRGKRKRRRNRIYRVCGIMMLLAVLVAFLGGALHLIDEQTYDSLHLTFWMEVVAIEFFGFSWMLKGGALLRDKKESQK